jgi:hypothetical protein
VPIFHAKAIQVVANPPAREKKRPRSEGRPRMRDLPTSRQECRWLRGHSLLRCRHFKCHIESDDCLLDPRLIEDWFFSAMRRASPGRCGLTASDCAVKTQRMRVSAFIGPCLPFPADRPLPRAPQRVTMKFVFVGVALLAMIVSASAQGAGPLTASRAM